MIIQFQNGKKLLFKFRDYLSNMQAETVNADDNRLHMIENIEKFNYRRLLPIANINNNLNRRSNL